MTLPHHDTAQRNQRCGRKTVLFGSQQCRDHDVAASFQLTVSLQADAATKVAHHESLVSFSDAKFPRHAGVLDRCQRRGTCAATGS